MAAVDLSTEAVPADHFQLHLPSPWLHVNNRALGKSIPVMLGRRWGVLPLTDASILLVVLLSVVCNAATTMIGLFLLVYPAHYDLLHQFPAKWSTAYFVYCRHSIGYLFRLPILLYCMTLINRYVRRLINVLKNKTLWPTKDMLRRLTVDNTAPLTSDKDIHSMAYRAYLFALWSRLILCSRHNTPINC